MSMIELRRAMLGIKRLTCAIVLVGSTLTLAGCASTAQQSLPAFKASLLEYVESGGYAEDVAEVANGAVKYLRREARETAQPAIVLDIDETSLSNWPYQVDSRFCYDAEAFHAWVLEAEAEPLAGVLELYKVARELDVAVFFVTGRHEDQRAATEANLAAVGFDEWETLDMRPRNDGEASAAAFKVAVRRRISEAGYTIIANVGDQESDLAGGYSRRAFKLPNPFYEVP